MSKMRAQLGGGEVMATLKEIFGENIRGDGRRFINAEESALWFEPIFLNGNRAVWFGLDERGYGMNFDANYGSWVEYHPPKPKKKITLYRPIFRTEKGRYESHNVWDSRKSEEDWIWSIVGWEEREIEVDDV